MLSPRPGYDTTTGAITIADNNQTIMATLPVSTTGGGEPSGGTSTTYTINGIFGNAWYGLRQTLQNRLVEKRLR